MSIPTNSQIIDAIAKVIDCRSHRRGRKPSWNLLVFTNDSGKVTVLDLETECKAVVGKREYKKRKPTGVVNIKKTKTETEIEIDTPSDVRISPITGKPVRKYIKRAVKQEPITSEEISAADKAICELAEAKVQLAQAKLARDQIDDARKRGIMDKAIVLMENKVKELDKFVNG